MKQITLDYDDIVGGFYMSILGLNASCNQKSYVLEMARKQTTVLFDYIEKWQESGMTLESLGNGSLDR
jgi:hypothetical protein